MSAPGNVWYPPGSPEWLSVISPSKAAAILGVSRWESPHRLWHRMKGNVAPEPPKDRFDVGHAFEAALAELWRIQNPTWQLSRGEVQVRNDSFGFPAVATIDRRARRGALRRVVEFKTARELEEWGDEFTDDAPADYVAQLQTQMALTGYTEYAAHLLVMGPWFKHHTYVVPFDPDLAGDILHACKEFYASLQANEAPPLDDSVATYECVRELNPNLEDRSVTLAASFGAEYLDAARKHKALTAELRGLKTRTLAEMGTAARAIARVGETEFPIARRQNNGKGSISLYPNTKTSLDDLRGLTA